LFLFILGLALFHMYSWGGMNQFGANAERCLPIPSNLDFTPTAPTVKPFSGWRKQLSRIQRCVVSRCAPARSRHAKPRATTRPLL